MPNYQIKLTPVDTYFFGGDKHRVKKNWSTKTERLIANYFVESNQYPQQTTLLGMLRYYLLFRSKKLLNQNSTDSDRTDAKDLIGKKSFAFGGTNDFKKIAYVSPLYFINKGKTYQFAPFDLEYELDDNNILKKRDKNFNAKKHYDDITTHKLISAEQDVIKLSDILTTEKQVGNKIVTAGNSNTEGFYKMHKKKLKEGWSFAVDAEIDLNDLDKEKNFVPFGGEKSIFEIELRKSEPMQISLPNKYQRKQSFVFLASDAFVKSETMKLVQFAVNQFASFRCLISNISNTIHFNDLPEDQTKTGGIKRSQRLQLLKRGSILYFNNQTDRDNFIQNLQTPGETKIGFNKYLTN